uniref:Uncharacterized protein n=1 Tax=Oryza meridionalis TaxID=40149 RepID=A0A0E0D7J8_9ORYZ
MEYETVTVKRDEPARAALMDSETAEEASVPPWGSVQAIDQRQWGGRLQFGGRIDHNRRLMSKSSPKQCRLVNGRINGISHTGSTSVRRPVGWSWSCIFSGQIKQQNPE